MKYNRIDTFSISEMKSVRGVTQISKKIKNDAKVCEKYQKCSTLRSKFISRRTFVLFCHFVECPQRVLPL